jgi:DNA-binding MarR family transcriptional regulator
VTEQELNQCLEHMHYAFRNLVREPDRLLAKHGLGRAHHRALYLIGHYTPSVGQAARRLNVSNQAFHSTMRDLVERDFVRRRTVPQNRRIRRLMLTPKGRRLERRIDGIQRGMFAAVAKVVGARKMAAWATVMAQLASQPPVYSRGTVEAER